MSMRVSATREETAVFGWCEGQKQGGGLFSGQSIGRPLSWETSITHSAVTNLPLV